MTSGRPPEIEIRPQWMDLGACIGHDPDLWFEEGSPDRNSHLQRAIDICHECPVEQFCLEYAIRNRIDYGVWGGKTPRERRRIRRLRRANERKSREPDSDTG